MIDADSFSTPSGSLAVQPIDHASLVLLLGGRAIYVDPVGEPGRYAALPPPTGILITHEHGDHLDLTTLGALTASGVPPIVAAAGAAAKLPPELRGQTTVLGYGESAGLDGVPVLAVAAHNTTPERLRYHPVGLGNGYVLELGGRRIYISGDTEPTDEMRALKGIDIAFLPMNLPYTMTAEQANEAARAFRPKIVYPFHYSGGTEPEKFAVLMQGAEGIEVRLRDWYAQSR